MMIQVRRLDGVHRAHHGDAQREHGEVGGSAAQPQCVVICVVNLAKAREEEEERGRERQRSKRDVSR